MNFAELIAPASIEDFFAHYWEKTFLHGPRLKREFANYFSTRDIERWVRSTRDGFFFVLYPEGDTVRIESFDAEAVVPSAVSDNCKKGFAQILKKVSDWHPLQGLVGHLEGFFHAKVGVNVFLTPAGARSHPTYTCNDNILVIQLEGEEVWELRELTLLQLELQEKGHLEFPDEWRDRNRNPVLGEVRLRPGEVLYIPRGMPHFAKAPETDIGLHLRIYISPLTWVDFFKTAVEHAAIHFPNMRRSLPPGFVESDELGALMANDFRALMDEFQNVPFERVLSTARRNRVALQGFPPSDFVGARTEPEEISPISEVERKPDVLCTVEEVLDAARRPKSSLFFGNHQINGPPGLRRAFEFVRDHKSFRVSEIPGLDEKGQLILVRRLFGEGLLRFRG